MTEVNEEQVEYAYDDLDDSAKEKAMQWHINCVHQNFGSDDEVECLIDQAKTQAEQFGAEINEAYWDDTSAAFEGQVRTAKFAQYLIDSGTLPAELLAQYVILAELIREGWVHQKVEIGSRGFRKHITKVDDIQEYFYSADDDSLMHSGMLEGARVLQLADSINWETLLVDMEERIEEKLQDLGNDLASNIQKELDWLTSEECFRECDYVNGWRFTKDGNII